MSKGGEVDRGWVEVRLADVARNIRGRVMPLDHPDLTYVGLDSVEPQTMRLLNTVPTSTMKSASIHFKPGDVLYGRLRPYLNKVISPDFEGLASAEFIPLTPARGVLPRFIQYLLNSAGFVSYASHLNEGDRPRVDYDQIGAYRFLLPSIPEQQRIVEAIESYFTRLDDAVATLERVQRNLKRYRASVLKAAVEGRLVPTEAELARAEGRDYEPASVLLERILAERRRRWQKAGGRGKYQAPVVPNTTDLPELPEGWCWATVDAVGDVLLGRRRAPEYRGPLRPYLRVANVRDDRLDLDRIKQMPFAELHAEHYLLRPGDILVSEGQSPELIGQSAVYRGGIDGLCFQSTLHRFRPFVSGPTSEFAQLVFRSHVRSGVFQKYASITTNIAPSCLTDSRRCHSRFRRRPNKTGSCKLPGSS